MMKKTLLTTGLIAFAFGAFAQFTADRLVVSQYGDGTTTLGITTVPIFLQEFPSKAVLPVTDPSVPTYTLAMPTVASGANQPITGKGSASNEGLVTLSPDGNFLTLFGYSLEKDATIATASPFDTRTIALVKADGSINTTTKVSGSGTFEIPRCAITTNGTDFWFNFSGGGLRYTALGLSTNTAVNSAPLGSLRSVYIYNGQLYETTNSSASGAYHIGKITATASGNKLPKSTEVNNANTAPTAVAGASASTSPNQMVLLRSALDAGEPDILYTANDATGFIEKWVLNTISSIWESKGTVTASGTDIGTNIKGITGRIIGGKAFIYANTSTQIISFEDVNALTSTINDTDNPILTVATAPTKTAFKGIAFTPGTTITTSVLPIKLSSFTGKSTLNGVQLSWTTSSELNNNHFDILRSTDGKIFNKIDEVAGANNSSTTLKYAFIDKKATKGVNYYKLKQVDNNGTGEAFGPIAVMVSSQATDLSVYANKASGQIKLNVFANQASDATVNIYDANGSVVATQKTNLEAGNNEISLTSQNAGGGLHIVSLVVDGVTLTKKFIFQ